MLKKAAKVKEKVKER